MNSITKWFQKRKQAAKAKLPSDPIQYALDVVNERISPRTGKPVRPYNKTGKYSKKGK